jgi:hypothetical protein
MAICCTFWDVKVICKTLRTLVFPYEAIRKKCVQNLNMLSFYVRLWMIRAIQSTFDKDVNLFLDDLTLENGTDSLSRNVGNELPNYTVPVLSSTATEAWNLAFLSRYNFGYWDLELTLMSLPLHTSYLCIRHAIIRVFNSLSYDRSISSFRASCITDCELVLPLSASSILSFP